MSKKKAGNLMIYIEPTPYILGLIREVEKRSGKQVTVFFVKENLTQSWGLSLEGYNACLLPNLFFKAAAQLYHSIAAKPTVLHLAGWGHPLMLFALLMAFLMRVPVAVESDTQLPFELPRWKKAIKASLYPILFRIPAVVLPGGSRQAAYFRHYGVPEQKIFAAQMTVDVSAIRHRCAELGRQGRMALRQKLGIPLGDTVFVFVGRLVSHKGVADLMAAFESVSRQMEGVHLILVGDGPERDRVAAMAERIAGVRCLGRLDQGGVMDMFFAADVAVVPSHFEPWGLVVNEAMAAGLPVIASDRVGAVDDLVMEGRTGMVFRAGDITGLSHVMTKLAKEPSLRLRLAEGSVRLISNWTLEKSAKFVLSAWQCCELKRAIPCQE